MRGTRNNLGWLACATALLWAGCAAADEPTSAPAQDVPLGVEETATQDVVEDVAPEVEVAPPEEVTPENDVSDTSPETVDVAPETSTESDG